MSKYVLMFSVSVKVTNDSGHFEGIFVQARRQNASVGSTTEPLGLFSDPPTGTKLLNCGGVKGVSNLSFLVKGAMDKYSIVFYFI